MSANREPAYRMPATALNPFPFNSHGPINAFPSCLSLDLNFPSFPHRKESILPRSRTTSINQLFFTSMEIFSFFSFSFPLREFFLLFLSHHIDNNSTALWQWNLLPRCVCYLRDRDKCFTSTWAHRQWSEQKKKEKNISFYEYLKILNRWCFLYLYIIYIILILFIYLIFNGWQRNRIIF